jgi:hypothetical protein
VVRQTHSNARVLRARRGGCRQVVGVDEARREPEVPKRLEDRQIVGAIFDLAGVEGRCDAGAGSRWGSGGLYALGRLGRQGWSSDKVDAFEDFQEGVHCNRIRGFPLLYSPQMVAHLYPSCKVHWVRVRKVWRPLQLGAHHGETLDEGGVRQGLGMLRAVLDVTDDVELTQLIEQLFHGGREHWIWRST